jgi:ABC-type multidrug transport system fused ATPase/permease subunit
LAGDGVLGKGLRVLGRAIREEPLVFAVGVGGSVLFGAMTIGSAYVVGAVIGHLVVPAIDSGHTTVAVLAAGAGALLAVSLARVLGILGRRLGAGAMQYRLQASYRRKVTPRYLRLPMEWHHRHATGTLLSNANADVEAAWYPIAPLPFAVGTLVMLVGAIGALFATDWALALVGLTVFPAVFAVNVVYSRRMSPRATRAQQLRAELSALAHESFDGALIVKTMGREAEETRRLGAKAVELRDGLVAMGRIRGLFDPAMDALPNLGTLAVLVVGSLRLAAGEISVAELVSAAFLFTVLGFPVRAIGWVLGELPRSVVGWERVDAVLRATGDMPYGTAALDGAGRPAVLEFDRVSFRYPPSEPGEVAPEVLHAVSLRVPAGRTVALVGPTGSGKSTIASLAARLVDPDSGVVRIDGTDARDLAADSLAATVALVPQVPFVFDDTVRENVSLSRSLDGARDRSAVAGDGAAGDARAADPAVWEALRQAQADGFVAHLEHGLDTEVGERGTSLSGGQRQRLTLARAIAGGPRLLVLDDATSAVDPRVEAAILKALRESGHTASVLVVAYRRATVALADEVVYLEHGRVVARGTHRELLATVPGYANLVTAYEREEAERVRERAYDEPGVSEADLPGPLVAGQKDQAWSGEVR